MKVEEKDFASLDDAELTHPRQENGALPEMRFLRVAPGSGLIDKGADAGLPFAGKAPDLGRLNPARQRGSATPIGV